ncbi:MAG: TIGR00289 family protein [Candidatus Aenigmarchaeota archaeon]|nr:TIGR00289 family protein [Candidatus Aenigmarchaeota archaeon]
MNLAALLSGGKDSMYALYLAGRENKITYIVTITSENPESYMFHVPNVHLVEEQAKLMGIEIIKKTTKGEKEKELEDLKSVLGTIAGKVDGIVTGAIESNYQKQRVDKICKELNLKSLAPLWHKSPEGLLRSMIKDGFEIIITAVAAPPLDDKWLGRKIDEKCVEELVHLNKKYGIHPSGEGGEYESLVLDCPLFKKKLEVSESKKIWDEKTRSGHLVVDAVA